MHTSTPARPRLGRALPAYVLASCLYALSTPVGAAPQTFTVINDAYDDIVALWIAEPGSGDWRRIDIATHGIAAGSEDAFDVPVRGAGGCVRDVRFDFSRGPSLTHPALNVCKYSRYRPGAQRQRAARFVAE